MSSFSFDPTMTLKGRTMASFENWLGTIQTQEDKRLDLTNTKLNFGLWKEMAASAIIGTERVRQPRYEALSGCIMVRTKRVGPRLTLRIYDVGCKTHKTHKTYRGEPKKAIYKATQFTLSSTTGDDRRTIQID